MDSDGNHIRTLLLTFFYKFAPELIENGYVYSAVPPLFKIVKKDSQLYLLDDESLIKYKKEHQGEKYEIGRFKG